MKRIVILKSGGGVTVRVPVIFPWETEEEALSRAENDPLERGETIVGRVETKESGDLRIPVSLATDADIDGQKVNAYTFREAWRWDGSKVVEDAVEVERIKQEVRDGERGPVEKISTTPIRR